MTRFITPKASDRATEPAQTTSGATSEVKSKATSEAASAATPTIAPDPAAKDKHDLALATMSSWVASFADNLNNPIAGMLHALDLAEREMASYRASGNFSQDLVDDSLTRIHGRLQRMAEYVAELVAVARPPAIQPVLLQLTEVLAKLGPEADQAEFATSVAPDAASVIADPAQLRAALKALINNGLEATAGMGKPARRALVSVRRETRHGQSGVTVRVEDNGPGFTSGELPLVTDAFYSTKEAGSGLGLAIAKRFAQAHGGSLELGSSPALGGAAVTIFLPDHFAILLPKRRS